MRVCVRLCASVCSRGHVRCPPVRRSGTEHRAALQPYSDNRCNRWLRTRSQWPLVIGGPPRAVERPCTEVPRHRPGRHEIMTCQFRMPGLRTVHSQTRVSVQVHIFRLAGCVHLGHKKSLEGNFGGQKASTSRPSGRRGAPGRCSDGPGIHTPGGAVEVAGAHGGADLRPAPRAPVRPGPHPGHDTRVTQPDLFCQVLT